MGLLGMWSWMVVLLWLGCFVLYVRCVGINGFGVNVFCLVWNHLFVVCLHTIGVGDALFRGVCLHIESSSCYELFMLICMCFVS